MGKLPPFLLKLKSGTKGFSFDNGKLFLMDVPAMVFPTQTLALNQFLTMSALGRKKALSLAYIIGEIQSYMGASQITKRFGFKSSKSTVEYVYMQSEMVGTGRVEWIKLDTDNHEYIAKVTDCCWSKEYAKIFGKQSKTMCFLMSGLMSGALEAIFNKRFITIEKQCLAKGDKYCIFETKLEENADKNHEDYPELNYDDAFVKKFRDLNIFLKRNI